MKCWVWLCVAAGVCCASACARGARESDAPAQTTPVAPSQQPNARLIILGFDGVDPRWLSQWAAQGKLPTLARLMREHDGRGYHTLGSTNPPQSPVAWTSFATGTLPGEHGIFDFIARAHNRAATGSPITLKVATTSFEPQPAGQPVARNLRTGAPFWQLLGNQGIRVTALNVPYSFPPDPMRDGRMLSGLGVPDLRETNSTFTYAGSELRAEQLEQPPGGGVLTKIVRRGRVGRFVLEGPSIPDGAGERMQLPVEVRRAKRRKLRVQLMGVTHELPLNAWSEPIEVEFAHKELRVRGVLRLLPLEAGRRLRLFVSPISFHPRAPYAPISHPPEFSGQLADALGHVYKTVGWDHDTSALNAELIDEAAFLAELESIEHDRRAMLLSQLQGADFDLLIWVSTATDRAAHMFYRLTDPQHPRFDAAQARRYGDVILHEYERMDHTVQAALAQLRPADTLLIVSDHGFHGYLRGLHVNQWLRQNGYLVLKHAAVSSRHELLVDVDWSKTRAYAAGTGQIYFNLRGREREGCVAPAEVKPLAEEIRRQLLALRDTERGDAVVVKNVYLASDVFRGRRSSDAPDLQIAFAPGYRTSWETVLGGIPGALFADNDKKWSGDHAASDAADTPGIVLSNRPVDKPDPHIVDVAPTAHALFHRSTPEYYAGKSLFTGDPR